jgi:hypothetical protein
MSQHDMNIANQGFPNFRTDLNNALVALVSNSSGATEPTTTFAYQWWLDTSTTPTTLKIRNTANDTWITAMYLNQSTNLMTLAVGAGATGTPSYSTIGDLNTGIWFPAADTVALSTGGTERWRADSSGTFTVGGISTANRKFEVNLNGQTTISYGDNSLTTNLTLDNLSTSATTNHGSGMLWRVCTDSSATAINSGRIAVIKEQLWTSTASTQDSAMVFYTTLNGSLGERMRIDSAGAVGIGATSLTGINLKISKNITGATDTRGVQSDGQIQSDVTNAARYYISLAGTQNAAFTLTHLRHYEAYQTTFGASSTVTNQTGFWVDSTLTGATNNYGFRGTIAAGTNRYNLFMDGTANNYMAGSLGIGTTSSSYKLYVQSSAVAGFSNFIYTPQIVTESNATGGIGMITPTANQAIIAHSTPLDQTSTSIHFDGTNRYMSFCTVNNTERMRVDSNGYLLIGYTSSNGAYSLQVNSQIYATNATIATSDGRYKEEVTDLTDALAVIDKLRPVTFKWKKHPVHNFAVGKTDIGFIAQDVKVALEGTNFIDEIVKENECKLSDDTSETFLGLADSKLIPLLVRAIQQQQQQINELKRLANT